MIITRPIGIDLGTTNSAVAMLEPNERDLILCRDRQGRTTMPSCVWRHPRTGEVIVGHPAYARRGSVPEPVCSIKRSMGTQMTVALGDRQCSPVEISAHILRELKRRMEEELASRTPGDRLYDVSRAIITVPAYFGLPAIEATREAGLAAGLQVQELLHEPTAAAIYYSWKHQLGDGIYLVYDLGGGTFDVSVLRRISGEFQVLGIAGDNLLGGDDFDRRLAEYLRQVLVAEDYQLDLDVTSNPEDRLRFSQLVTLAERAKKELSSQEEITFRDQGTIRDKTGVPILMEINLDRSTFENLIDDLLERTVVFCQEALEKARLKAGVTLADVDHILLVGGSTYIPAVFEKVKRAFCEPKAGEDAPRAKAATPIRDEPETAVALGAALRAAAAGLGIGDDDHRLRLWFRTAGATRREEATISGTVEPLQPNLTLVGGAIRLRALNGEVLEEVPLDANLHFAFRRVPLQPEALNEFSFEILDNAGVQVAEVQRIIAHAANQREAVGSTLATAVLSKPILLEGTDGDRPVRQVLLAEGISLPAKASFTFAVSQPGGLIRLPIIQENRIIKELRADVGELPIGTPVEVEISCNEQVYIQVHFAVAGQSFGGDIEPPPPDVVPSEYDIQQLDQKFSAALERLEPEEAERLRLEYDQVHQDLDEARSGADYPKVIQRGADLEGLIVEARRLEPLTPPLEVLEQHVARCRQLIPQAKEMNPAAIPDSLDSHLTGWLERGREAYKQRQRQVYRDACQAVGASLKFLSSLSKINIIEDELVDVTVRAHEALEKVRQLTQFLLISSIFAGRGELLDETTQMLTEIEELEARLATAPQEVLKRCQVLLNQNQRLWQQLAPEGRQRQDLEGLLHIGSQPQAGISLPGNIFDRS